MAWKQEYIFLKYHWNLYISEILQKVLHMKNILELLYIASDKFPEHKGSISSFSFYGQPPNY